MAGTLSMMSPGFAMGIAGTAIGANAAAGRRSEFASSIDKWLPDLSKSTGGYFGDLGQYLGQATDLSRSIGKSQFNNAMDLRNQEFPGFTGGMQGAWQTLAPMLKGQVPDSLMQSFQRAGGASSAGLGFGGSAFGALNTGLFGARGSLGAMQAAYGLLPALMGAMPSPQDTSVMNFLGNVLTPEQRVQEQMGIRQQNIGIASTIAGMPTSGDMWGQWLTSTGGEIMGADQATVTSAIGAASKVAGGML